MSRSHIDSLEDNIESDDGWEDEDDETHDPDDDEEESDEDGDSEDDSEDGSDEGDSFVDDTSRQDTFVDNQPPSSAGFGGAGDGYDSGTSDDGQDLDETEETTQTTKEEWTQDDQQRKKLICGFFMCLCCIIIIIAIVILAVVLSGKDKNKNDKNSDILIEGDPPSIAPDRPNPAPFSFPTKPPVIVPTDAPTISKFPTMTPVIPPTGAPSPRPTTAPTITASPTESVPDELIIIADQDTYIYRDGFYVGEAFGKESSFLVQNGPVAYNEIPDAFALMTFNITRLPPMWRLEGRDISATLRLTHIRNVIATAPSTYTIIMLPETRLKVEYLHGYIFNPKRGTGTIGPSFVVAPSAINIDIDITDLLFNETAEEGYGEQLFLMIDNLSDVEQEAGDRFKSRESESPPTLTIGLYERGVPRPSPYPTISPVPTISKPPSSQPTISAPPSISHMPSLDINKLNSSIIV